MRRLIWSQLRFRSGRALALLAGMLVAATAFTVLTAAARTAQVRTVGTVSAHFRPAYDILVRPAGARSRLESATGTVQPDFLSGIYGGITMAQWHQIQKIAGVQVAAPIAMVGYTLMYAAFPVWLPAAGVARPGRQLYRVTTTWVSANGAARIPQPPSYVYVTPDRVRYHTRTGATTETVPGHPTVAPCPATGPVASPFSYAALATTWCFSKIDGQGLPPRTYSVPRLGSRPGFSVSWQFPMLIAAVDPAAEARLDGLNRAVTSGQYLPEGGLGTGPNAHYYQEKEGFPVLAAADSGIGEYSVSRVQELSAPSAPPTLGTAVMRQDSVMAGRTVLSTTITARHAYQYLLDHLRSSQQGSARLGDALSKYWSVGPVRYRRVGSGDLVPAAVRNPVSVWGRSAAGFTRPRWTTPAPSTGRSDNGRLPPPTLSPRCRCRSGRSARERSPSLIRCPGCRWGRTSRRRPHRPARRAGRHWAVRTCCPASTSGVT